MYSIHEYGNMIADPDRFRAYREAILAAVRPGDVVLEIGCGPGVFALLAAHAGARTVYAIECEPVIEVARQLAQINGLSDRVHFFQSDSRKVLLPERVRVIISDVRGAIPFFGTAIATINDARQRFLAESGFLIPQRDVLKAAIVEAPRQYEAINSPWCSSAADLKLSIAGKLALNTPSYHHVFAEKQLLTEAHIWCILDYQQGVKENAANELNFLATRSGTAHGVAIWFEAELDHQFGYSTGPGSPKRGISGQLFLPWLAPVSLSKGEEVCVTLRADRIHNEYVWRWETRISTTGKIATHFRQSSFQGAILSPESLRRRAAGFVPSLSEQGQADRYLLDLMDGRATLQQVAQSAAAKFPAIFARWEDALSRAADLAAQFSR